MSNDSGGSDRLIIGWTCDDCDEALGDEPNMHDLVERFRREHEDETGHTTTVHVVREERIIPSMGDRMDIGEAIIDMADGEIDWICPECCRSGEELGRTKRCPDCDERLREVLPDGGEVSGSDRKNCWCDHVDGTCKPCQRREAGVPEPGVR